MSFLPSSAILPIFLMLSFVMSSSTQTAWAQNKKVIFLTDKKNTPYSISQPEAYLSARSINRRNRFNIPIDSSDLPVNPSYVAQISSLPDVQMLGTLKWMNALIIDCNNASVMNQISLLPFVKSYASIALRKKESAKAKPLIETFSATNIYSGRSNNSITDRYQYGSSYNQIALHNGQLLHNIGADGENMMIAFFDSGYRGYKTNRFIDSALRKNQIFSTKDIIQNNAEVNEDDAHGLYCLSVIAGQIPGSYVGSCPQAQYVLIRTEEVNSEQMIEEYFWAMGAEYADSCGADVFTSSVGYTTFDDSAQDHVYSDLNGNKAVVTVAADKAAGKGIFVVTSAGNEGGSSWKYIGTPADGDSVYAVGATDLQRKIAGFSSWGPTFDGRIKPDGLSVGVSTYLIGTNGSVITANGTSFSTPNLAGLITCLWQLLPDVSNAKLLQTLKQSSDRYASPSPQYGYGIPDMAKALGILLKEKAERSFSIKDCSVTLQWKSYDCRGMGYMIQRKLPSESGFTSLDTLYSNQSKWDFHSYSFTDFPIRKEAGYRIIQLLDTSQANPLLFTLDSTTLRVPEICNRNEITLYPNPAKDFFRIEMASAPAIEDLQLGIFSQTGQHIKTISLKKPEGYFSTPEISTAGMPKGIYIIKIFNGKTALYTQKLMLR
jgi:hypothetical protein